MGHLNFTNLRVFIDENDHFMYTELTSRAANAAEDIPFAKMPDLFIAAASLGAKYGDFRELKAKKKDIFVADAFDTKTQIPILAALAFKKTRELETISDAKTILEICQGWATGGIKTLYTQVLAGEGLRPLYRLVDFIKVGSQK